MRLHSTVFAAAALTLLPACAQSDGEQSTRDALNTALRAAARANSQVSLPDVVGGAWTQVLFVCPYEDKRSVEDRLGFAWDAFPGPDETEGRVTYVFASAGSVVSWATLGRDAGDPCGGASPLDTVAKESAVFMVVQTANTTDGAPFYSLVHWR